MSPRHHALQIAGLAVVLLVAWRLVLGWTGVRADFADSNYQSNLIRLEDYVGRPTPPPVVLAGSSVTGRLLPRYFADTPTPDVGNLGLDGSSALLGLEVIGAGTALPRVVLVETYLLGRPWGGNDDVLVRALDGAGVRLARADPVFRAATRPSALLYSWLKSRAPADAGRPAPTASTTPPPAAGGPVADPDPLPDRWRRAMVRLRDAGVRVVLVDIPLGREEGAGPPAGEDFPGRVARELGLERIDLRTALASAGVVPAYTDGLHLDVPTARRAAALLAGRLAADPSASRP